MVYSIKGGTEVQKNNSNYIALVDGPNNIIVYTARMADAVEWNWRYADWLEGRS